MRQHHPAPLKTVENRVWRFYQGGGQLEELRGRSALDDEFPEEWVASTTEASGATDGTGLSLVECEDGERRVLREEIAKHPVAYLGQPHVAAYGASPGLLVKLLDPSERLPVHVHPNREFARTHLRSIFGKAEAWIILGVREGASDPHVYLGLAEDVSREEYLGWIREQNIDRLLSSLHRLPVEPGDVIYVPSGMPHAIGGGLLLAEVQEDSDHSFMCEHRDYPIDVDGAFLGLTLEEGFRSVDIRMRTREEIERYRIHPQGHAVVYGECETFFGVDRVTGDTERRSEVYELAVITGGQGTLESSAGSIDLRAGDGVVLPATLPSWHLTGDLEALIFRGPVT